MAEYIDRNLINYHKERVLNRWAESRHTDCDVSYKYIVTSGDISNIPTADVIERSEYEKVLEGNKQLKHIISDKVDKDLKCAFEVKELRSKIDKAIEQTYKVRDMVLHSNRMYEPNDVLEIIDEISKLFEEL